MSISLLFWIIWLLTFLFSTWATWPIHLATSGTLVVFVLIGLLGWKVFGPAIKP